jgi:parallel beta-helix repeat protein
MNRKIINLIILLMILGSFITIIPSKIPTVSAYTPHAPIYIDGNADFSDADDDGVINPGATGTENDPFIIQGWDIDASSTNGIYIEHTDAYFIIRNCYIHDGDPSFSEGIFLEGVSNGKIENSNIVNNEKGIYLWIGCYNVTISNNSIHSNDLAGIFFDYSSNNLIINNSIYDNSFDGIYFDESPYNTISQNHISGNRYGIYPDYLSPFINIHNNSIFSNNQNGIYLDGTHNHTISNNSIYSTTGSGILIDLSPNNLISYNNIYSNTAGGISLWPASDNIISNNNIFSNDRGITLLQGSSNNSFSHNNISQNTDWGIRDSESPDNEFINNYIDSNGGFGIKLDHSLNLTVKDNVFYNNGIVVDGNQVPYWNSHTILNNTANDRPIYYYKDTSDIVTPQNAIGVIFANCTNCTFQGINSSFTDLGMEAGFSDNVTITDNDFRNNKWGIFLRTSKFNLVSNNSFHYNDRGIYGYVILNSNISHNNFYSNSDDGMYLYVCRYNGIFNNTVSKSTRGINIWGSSLDNQFYHNNMINNTDQAWDWTNNANQWDIGYPGGGNYWSDFDESSEGAYDDFQGANQDVVGSDGIVDNGTAGGGGVNPYFIDADSWDNYPLIEPAFFTPPQVIQNLQATPGDSIVNLTWATPSWDGGSTIIGYNIYKNGTTGVYAFVPGDQTWFEDIGLINGMTYIYHVSAVNAIGEGPKSQASATPNTIPSAPENLMAKEGYGYVNISWEAPGSDGGSDIIGYFIYRNGTNGSYNIVSPDQLWYNDTNVSGGITYTYNVSCSNKNGESANSTVEGTALIPIVPSEPKNPFTGSGNGFVNLSWKIPIFQGGSNITGYNIYKNGSTGVYIFIPADQLWFNDTNVTNELTYVYNVTCVNGVGEGPHSIDVLGTPSAQSVPSAPRNLTYEEGDGGINLAWDTPSYDGNSSIIGYNIYRNGTEVPLDFVSAGQLWFNDTGLINGVTYTYNVSAVNGKGEGPNSTISGIPGTIPSVPENVQIDDGYGYVNISWTPPKSDGGFSIIEFYIYRNATAGAYANVLAGQLWFNDTSVSNGTSYTYNITAINAMGEGPNTDNIIGTPLIQTVPLRPQGPQTDSGDTFVNLTWNRPLVDGGSPIIEYNIYRNGTIGIYDTVTANQLWFNDTNVFNDLIYTYNITAVNIIGEGLHSMDVLGTPFVPTVPSTPQNLQKDEGDKFINLTWEIPTSDGNSPILGYYVYRNQTAGYYDIIPHAQLWYLDANVINGITYTYNVSAYNAIGESIRTSDITATPRSLPSAPQYLQIVPGDGYLNLTWDAPLDDGGFPIIGYNIYKNDINLAYDTISANELWYLDSLVDGGTTYTYFVSAITGAGKGPLSNGMSEKAGTVPSAPADLKANTGDSSIILTWDAPVSDGGYPIINYAIYRGEISGDEAYLVQIGNLSSYTDINVTNGATYYYRVVAINNIGEGVSSAPVNATPKATIITTNQIPTCSIFSPLTGSTINGILEINGTASDSDGEVLHVEIRIDDRNWIIVAGTTSWSYSLDTTSLSNGEHTVYVKAYDGINYSSETQITVSVENPFTDSAKKSIFEESWFWALIVLVIVVLLILFLLTRRRKDEYEVEIEGQEEPEEKVDEQKESVTGKDEGQDIEDEKEEIAKD